MCMIVFLTRLFAMCPIHRPEPEIEEAAADCSEECAIPPPKTNGDTEADKKSN